MKKVSTFLAGAVGVAVVALLIPANVFANCPNLGQVTFTSCDSGSEVIYSSADAGPLSGRFWIQGLGDNANDVGQDSGIFTGANGNGNWITDLGIPDSLCLGSWDWGSAGTDGCPTGAAPLWLVINDSANRAMVVSTGFIGAGGVGGYDFGNTNNGPPSPNFGGAANGLALGRAVHVAGSSTISGDVSLDVAALTVPNYNETPRSFPGTVQLRGSNNGSPVVGAGSGAKTGFLVDRDTDVCWEIADGAFTATLGCVRVGGLTPSQNVLNAKTAIGKGKLNFSWEVSAQFDVLGFNIIQKNATKNTERRVNDTLIPISGMNDAQGASYSFSAGRKDLQATRGGFEIELVRTNGETSRTPAPLR